MLRVWNEDTKKITYEKQKTREINCSDKLHYFFIGEKSCMCRKYDGNFDPTKKK